MREGVGPEAVAGHDTRARTQSRARAHTHAVLVVNAGMALGLLIASIFPSLQVTLILAPPLILPLMIFRLPPPPPQPARSPPRSPRTAPVPPPHGLLPSPREEGVGRGQSGCASVRVGVRSCMCWSATV